MITRPAPDFALSFSSDAVHLLEREPGAAADARSWRERGTAAFGAPDFRDAMSRLRAIAQAGAEAPVQLIIPDDQILYTSLPVQEPADPQAAVGAALDGLTPYAVDDLAWDWRPEDAGAGVRVAAVARQTLREAEEFARRYGFSAAAFVADPAEALFPAMPRFDTAGAEEDADALFVDEPWDEETDETAGEADAALPDATQDGLADDPGTLAEDEPATGDAPASEAAAPSGETAGTATEAPDEPAAQDTAAEPAEDNPAAPEGAAQGAASASETAAEAAATDADTADVTESRDAATADAQAGTDGAARPFGAAVAAGAAPSAATPARKGAAASTDGPAIRSVTIPSATALSGRGRSLQGPGRGAVPAGSPVASGSRVSPQPDRLVGPLEKGGIIASASDRHPGARGGIGALLVMLGTLLLGLALIWAFATPNDPQPVAAAPEPDLSLAAAPAGAGPDRPATSDAAGPSVAPTAALKPIAADSSAVSEAQADAGNQAASAEQAPREAAASPVPAPAIPIPQATESRPELAQVKAEQPPATPTLAADPVLPAPSRPAALPVRGDRGEDPAAPPAALIDAAPAVPSPAASSSVASPAANLSAATPTVAAEPAAVPPAPQPAAGSPAPEPATTAAAPSAADASAAPTSSASAIDAAVAAALSAPVAPPAAPVASPAQAPGQAAVAPPDPGTERAAAPASSAARSGGAAPTSATAPSSRLSGPLSGGPPPRRPGQAAQPQPARADAPPAVPGRGAAPVPTARRPAARPTNKAAAAAGPSRTGVAPAPPKPAARSPDTPRAPAPSSSRPPPRPEGSADESLTAAEMTLAERRNADRMLADLYALHPHLPRLMPARPADAERQVEARPARRPPSAGKTATDAAIDAAVKEAAAPQKKRPADAGSQPEKRPLSPGGPESRPGRTDSSSVETRSVAQATGANRPVQRPSRSSGKDGKAAAVEAAIAQAVEQSGATPGGVALSALSSSPLPARKPARGADTPAGNGPDREAEAIAALAASRPLTDRPPDPEPAPGPAPPAAAPAPAAQPADAQGGTEAELAQRKRLDEQLQAQAEARVRARAAADAKAEMQARAAAEARARAQAEAEERAAIAKRGEYRPPEIDDEPEVATTVARSPASGTVAKAATVGGMDLARTQVIGVIGAGRASRGLIRLRNGKIVTVRLGDKIDGGAINAIGNGRISYVKGGRQYNLAILNGR